MKLSKRVVVVAASMALVLCCVACDGQGGGEKQSGTADIVTDTSFMADIVGNVAGDRLTVMSLVSEGADPHSFEPTPQDARSLAECSAVVINVVGLAPAIDDLVAGVVSEDTTVIEAAEGLPGLETDPHCWLDPLGVVAYVENITAGLSELDPGGAATYRANASEYVDSLHELDAWIDTQVRSIAPERRILVTGHESLGRFAERYGFRVVGAIYPTTSGEGSPSARSVADLVSVIEATGAPAIFVEEGADVDLAEQVGEATGVKVVTGLYTHSLGPEAATYIEMMRWNVSKIIEALRYDTKVAP